MGGHWTDEFSFSTGAIRSKGFAYLIATEDRIAAEQKPHHIVVTWKNGTWGQLVNNWACPSLCVARVPKEQMIAIGEFGDVQVLGSGEQRSEQIADGPNIPEKRGTLRCVRTIGGRAYAAGMDRQVYRREDANKWVSIDATMRPKPGSSDVVGFESIDGFSERDIYAVGWQGAIWHYDGKKWRQIDSPTNVILTNTCCAGDGNVYISGRLGLLLRGRNDTWEVIEHESTAQDLWGLAWYDGKLYVSSLKQVFTLEGDALAPVDMGDDPAESAYHLSAADGVLWSIGAKDVMAFDGSEWTRID